MNREGEENEGEEEAKCDHVSFGLCNCGFGALQQASFDGGNAFCAPISRQ
jgi:hypothetical protein